MNLNELRDRAYRNACEHGFHEEDHSVNHCKCLIISELMEAVEADRKGLHSDMESFEKYETRRITFEENFERHIKDTVEDELSDACIRIFDLAGYKDIDLEFECAKTAEFNSEGMFTDKIYNVVHVLVGCELLGRCLALTLKRIFSIAEDMGVNIEHHINLKMQYNESRPRLHGKKY